MRLETWAERQFRVVDQDGDRAERVRLIAADGGGTWQVWERDELEDVHQWAAEAEAYLAELAEEWPPKPIQVLFVAETKSGTERSQLPRTVRGKNKSASDGIMRSESKAVADAMDSVSRTMRHILESANVQIGVLTKTVQDQAEQTHSLLEFIREVNTQQALQAEQAHNAINELLGSAKEYLPAVMGLVIDRFKKPENIAKKAFSTAETVVKLAPKE